MGITATVDTVRRAPTRPGWVEAVLGFVVVTAAVTAAVWLGAREPFVETIRNSLAPYPGSGLFGGWFRYDAGWYTAIATDGYRFDGPMKQSTVAFFPAYPGLLWALHAVTGISIKLLGTLVTLAAGLGVVVLFRRWCDDRVERPVARAAMVTLLIYPYAFYLMGAVYGDALFFLAALSAFVLLERDHPVLAGLAGAVATASRPVGVAVVVGLVAVTLWRKGTVARREGRLRVDLSTLRPADGGVLLGLTGIIGWMTYLGVRFGHPLAFQEVQQAPGWDQGTGPRTWLKISWFEKVERLPGRVLAWWRTGDSSDFEAIMLTVGIMVQALIVLAFLWLAWKAWKRVGWGYSVYAFALIAIPLAGSKDLQGAGRYLLAAFPCYLVLGQLLEGRPKLRMVTWCTSAVLLLGWSFAFGKGYYVA